MSAQRELSEKVTSRHWAWYSFAYWDQIFIIFSNIFWWKCCSFLLSFRKKMWSRHIWHISACLSFQGRLKQYLKRQIVLFYPLLPYHPNSFTNSFPAFMPKAYCLCCLLELLGFLFPLFHPRPPWLQLAALEVTVNNPTRSWLSLRNCRKKNEAIMTSWRRVLSRQKTLFGTPSK